MTSSYERVPTRVDGAQRLAQPEQMGMRIHHSGDHGLPGEIEPFVRGPASARAPRLLPTNAIRPARTASASATGRFTIGGVDLGVRHHQIRLLKRQDGEQYHHVMSLGRLVSTSWALWNGSRGPRMGTRCAIEFA